MPLKLGSVCYLPPPEVGSTAAFFANLNRWRHAYPIHFYSDHAWEGLPEGSDLAKCESPEVVRDMDNAWSIPKLAFLHGITVALENKLDYFLILEPDCRVWGDDWDKDIFNEFLRAGEDLVCGGTWYAWNMYNGTIEWAEQYAQWRNLHAAKPWFSKMDFGGAGCADKADAHLHTNGALTVLRTSDAAWMFPKRNHLLTAQTGSAYDVAVGYGLKAIYGTKVFSKVVPLSTIFSYYGDLLFSEEQRTQLLLNGTVRAVHQVKSDWF